jgi:hypothetical protein
MPNGALISAIFAALIATAALCPASAKEHRSREVTREFQHEEACPSTGARNARCPRYVRDHIVPLACGGPDAVANMQQQTVAAAKAKDRRQRRGCR